MRVLTTDTQHTTPTLIVHKTYALLHTANTQTHTNTHAHTIQSPQQVDPPHSTQSIHISHSSTNMLEHTHTHYTHTHTFAPLPKAGGTSSVYKYTIPLAMPSATTAAVFNAAPPPAAVPIVSNE